jgi:hypothetical protein
MTDSSDDTVPLIQILESMQKLWRHAREWLDKTLKSIGWSTNCTGYDPIKGAHSITDVRASFEECVKMAIKQALLMKGVVPDCSRLTHGRDPDTSSDDSDSD